MTSDDTPDVATRHATIDDLDAAAAVLGAAFADYPWTRWTVDAQDHVGRITALQQVALERLGLPFGDVWVTTVAEVVACVALWMDSAVGVPVEIEREVGAASAEIKGARHDASVRAERQIADIGWRPSDRYAYLGTIGTRPEWQRHGLARRTIAPMLRRADDEGLPAFLETSSTANVALYTSLGFEVTGHLVIDGGGPDVWAMLRRPAPPGERR